MTRSVVFAVASLLCPAALCAASPPAVQPEALLPADALVYVRFDGIQPHEEAWHQTILGTLVRDELRPLVKAIGQSIADAVGPDVLAERLLAGAEPDQLVELQQATAQLPRLLELLNRQGIVAGLEYTSGSRTDSQAVLQRGGQVVVVFPQAGGERDSKAVFGSVRLIAHLASANVSEETVAERPILRVAGPPFSLACWREGEHVLLTVGTRDVDHTLEVLRGKRANLTANPLLERSTGFDEYETYLRGFVDVGGMLERVREEFPPAEGLANELGLAGLKSVSLHVGFDGGHQRSTMQLNAPGPRAGLLQLLSPAHEIRLNELPPLPPDAASVRCAVLDFAAAFEEALKARDAVARIAAPGRQTSAAEIVSAFERGAGIDLRKDLLAYLGPRVLTYSSSSEGPFVLGMTLAVEVRDGAGIAGTVSKLVAALARTPGTDVTIVHRAYHGVDLHMLRVGERGIFFVPTFAVVDGWLVAGLEPQPVQGFILRSQKGYSRWPPPQVAEDVLRQVKQRRPQARITGLTVIEPRTTVASVASFAPLVVGSIQAFSDGGGFDTSLIPNAQAITEPLTHNVTVVSDDGQTVRVDSWASLPIPFPATGIETYFATVFLSSRLLFLLF